MFNNMKWLIFIVPFITAESRAESLPKNNPGGPAFRYSESHEILESARPNDATISMYEDRKSNFIKRQKS